MQWGFYFDQTRCTGCFTCVVACKDWYDVPAGPTSWMRISCIEKGKYPDLFAAYLRTSCYHCQDPACMAACPADAVTKRERDGIVLVDGEQCLGKEDCGLCLDACPYDAPQFGNEASAAMEKCNFCVERLEKGRKPICVDACPMRALDAGPMEDLTARYGNERVATGFTPSGGCTPSTIFKSKAK